MNKQASSGGAIFLHTTPSVIILHDTFTKCFVSSDSGGVHTYRCSTSNCDNRLFDNCKFLYCTGLTGGAGGLYLYDNNQYNQVVTNSLFSQCSNYYGGALYLRYSLYSYPPSSSSSGKYAVEYCYFNKNSFLAGGAGNDVAICAAGADYITEDDKQIFIFCLSNTLSDRVGYASRGYSSTDVSWLPLAFPVYVPVRIQILILTSYEPPKQTTHFHF